MLELVGIEHTEVITTTVKKEYDNSVAHENVDKVHSLFGILQIDTTSSNNYAPHGTHKIPFEFTVPTCLTPSFLIKEPVEGIIREFTQKIYGV
jgi:hypothetical protein